MKQMALLWELNISSEVDLMGKYSWFSWAGLETGVNLKIILHLCCSSPFSKGGEQQQPTSLQLLERNCWRTLTKTSQLQQEAFGVLPFSVRLGLLCN